MAKVIKKSAAPLYFAAAAWLLWGLLLPLYRPIHYILVVTVSIGAAFLGKAICPDREYEKRDTATQAGEGGKTEEAPKKEQKGVVTNDPAVAELIVERDRAVGEMKRLNDAIKDETISAQIDRLEADTEKIIAHVAEHPEKLPQIRKFMNYYLPTTLKLLNAYDRMDDAGISGENIDSTKAKVEKTMAVLVTAFDRQLDALFGDEALDVATDIKVIETLLAREGLVGDQPFAQADEKKSGDEIKLTTTPKEGEENHE